MIGVERRAYGTGGAVTSMPCGAATVLPLSLGARIASKIGKKWPSNAPKRSFLVQQCCSSCGTFRDAST